MQTAIKLDHDYKGPTINPQGEALARLTEQFKSVTGPEQLRRALKAWGLTDEISPKQANFWSACSFGERSTFCRIAGLQDLGHREWKEIQPRDRDAIWKAIGSAATWGERLKGRW